MKNPIDSIPFSTGNSLAVAISGSGRPGDLRHLAFLYALEDGTKKLLHLGWHKQLKWHPWDESYYWFEFDHLDAITQEVIAESLEAIATANFGEDCGIQYSAIYSDNVEYFDSDMKYSGFGDGQGLTCATFVLAVMKMLQLQLVDASTWPVGRLADKSWLEKILKILSKRSDLIRHVSSQMAHKNMLRRYRPEEVVVTPSLFQGAPLTFKVLEAPSKMVLKNLPVS